MKGPAAAAIVPKRTNELDGTSADLFVSAEQTKLESAGWIV